MKICIVCGLDKELIDFNIRKDSKDGHNNKCKNCKSFYTKQLRANDPTYHKRHLEQTNRYKENNKESVKNSKKQYYLNNREKLLKHNEEYQKKYLTISDNRHKRNEKIKIRFKERMRTDSLFMLSVSIKNSIKSCFRRKKYNKSDKTGNILGCSFVEFKIHLESKFEPWMTWENKGFYNGELNYGWDIDHIIPVSSANTKYDLLRLNHYTNLQPLCSKINRDIKKDNITWQRIL